MFDDLTNKEKFLLAIGGGALVCFAFCRMSKKREGYSSNAGLGSSSSGSFTVDHIGDALSTATEETYDSPSSSEFVDADAPVRENFSAEEVNVMPGQPSGCSVDRQITQDELSAAYANQVSNAVYYTASPATVIGSVKGGKDFVHNSNSFLKSAIGLDLLIHSSKNQHNLALVEKTAHHHTPHNYSGRNGGAIHNFATVGAHKSYHGVNVSTTGNGYGIHM
jgi:hypothetical protein